MLVLIAFSKFLAQVMIVTVSLDHLLCSGKETEFHIEPELTLELMMAANYLHTWTGTQMLRGIISNLTM